MKKVLLMIAVCAAMVACNNGKTTANAGSADSAATDSTTAMADTTVYEGMIPAADCAGIKYRIAMATDSTNGFPVTQSYMESDTKAKTTENFTGKYEIVNKKGNNSDEVYYTFALGKDYKVNFKLVNDSTLRFVNNEFKEPEAVKGMSYDLKLKK